MTQTMTLNLSDKEMEVVNELAVHADISKTQVLRQALKLYQLIHVRLQQGETFHFSGDSSRQMLFVGLGLGEPR